MPVLNVQLVGAAGEAKRFTAPSGMVYEIHAIFGSVRAAANNDVYVLTRYMEEEFSTLASFDGNDIIYHIITSAVVHNNVNFDGAPLSTKHITIVQRSGAGMQTQVIILYILRKASHAELIWEFVSRGKNP